jgi:hypothetical protein
MDATKEENKVDDAVQLEIFIYWLKISLGIIGGILHYVIQKTLYETVLFYMQGLLRGLIIVAIIFGYLFMLHILFYLIIRFSKAYFTKNKQVKFSNLQLSLKFSGIFLTIFLISASISFYIGS